jgi:protein SCO1/2
VSKGVSGRVAAEGQTGGIGFATLTTVLIAFMPKCPLCWMALMSALGVGSTINFTWPQPLAVSLLFLSVSALLLRARRRGGYGPFWLGLASALAIYLSKFRLNHDVGVYLSGAALTAASIWNALPKRRAAADARCHC